jgi:Ca-activated chloride channel family protein
MERGSEAYRAGDYAAAAKAWDGLPGADASYNLGNALAKQGRYKEAIDAYDQALAREPGMEDAIANRKAVLAAMQRQPPSGGKQDGDRKGDAGQDQGQGEGGTQGSGGDSRREPGEGRGEARTGGNQADGAPAEAPRPEDAAAQQAADAAQRERMARALNEAEKSADAADEAAAQETTAEREQRLANEAWLRRIPDDPGGLLRERFRLERLRREREGR